MTKKCNTKCILCKIKIETGKNLCEGCEKLPLTIRIKRLAEKRKDKYSNKCKEVIEK